MTRNEIIDLYESTPRADTLADLTIPLTVEGGGWAPAESECWTGPDVGTLLEALSTLRSTKITVSPRGGDEWAVSYNGEHLGTIDYRCDMPDWDETEISHILRREFYGLGEFTLEVDA